MCAQSMIAAPLRSLMSSSTAPLGSRSQAYPRCLQYWDHLISDASSNASTATLGASSGYPQQDRYGSYVERWIADTASQSRARSVPAPIQSVQGNRPGIQPELYEQYKPSVGTVLVADRAPQYPITAWPHAERAHRSLSPELNSKLAGTLRRSSLDATDEQIASYLQIPLSINSSRGSLAEFAAQITCLFWFEDFKTLDHVENSASPIAVSPLPQEATPTVGFRKWVTTLLSTTQVSQSVILLALLFVYRLKKLTVNVKGKAGSEYRLLTVALMLGNKFLDDNTYTNKTWADVSGISVSEIHVMEVEFLSNMKYNLYTSAEQWTEWHILLGKFSDYFEKTSRTYPAVPTPVGMVTSTPHLNGMPALPFTPPSEQLSPPNAALPRMPAIPRQLPVPNPLYNMATNLAPPTASRMPHSELRPPILNGASSSLTSHKRGHEDDDEGYYEQPTKQPRMDGHTLDKRSNTAMMETNGTLGNTLLRLPLPTTISPPSSLPVTTATPFYAPSYPTTIPPTATQYTLPAPPVLSHDQLWQPSRSVLANPLTPVSMLSSTQASIPSILANTPQSLRPLHHPEQQEISPTRNSFPNSQETHSPSGYLMYRNSPYKPVRQVNTLLATPPSMALQNPLRHMSQQNTYYQPLSKAPIEPRQGMVPYLTPRQFQVPPMDPSRHIASLDYTHLLSQR